MCIQMYGINLHCVSQAGTDQCCHLEYSHPFKMGIIMKELFVVADLAAFQGRVPSSFVVKRQDLPSAKDMNKGLMMNTHLSPLACVWASLQVLIGDVASGLRSVLYWNFSCRLSNVGFV